MNGPPETNNNLPGIAHAIFMGHSYIKDHYRYIDIVDCYLSGKLSAEERMRFEEHFVDCAVCRGWLLTVDCFRAGLRIVAAEDAMRLRAYIRLRLARAPVRVAWLIRRRRAPLLAAVILLIALPMTLLILEWRGARRDLARATQDSSEWRRKYEKGEQMACDAAKADSFAVPRGR